MNLNEIPAASGTVVGFRNTRSEKSTLFPSEATNQLDDQDEYSKVRVIASALSAK
jgi:hypothetical protein